MMMEKLVAWTIGIVAVIAALLGVWINNQPVDVTMRLNEVSVHNDNLPPMKDAIVTLTLDNETKTDTIRSLDAEALFANIPHSAIGKEARITVECKDWLPVDTTFVLDTKVCLDIARNPRPYGNVQFRLWNVNTERTNPKVVVSINGHETTADAEGMIRYSMPLTEQHTYYIIKAPMALENDTLHVPTTESTTMVIK